MSNIPVIVHVCYRAKSPQEFRRNEMMALMENLEAFFKDKNDYKIVICEQNDANLFNRGKLLNIAFLESEKEFQFEHLNMHMNTDYAFHLDKPFPADIFILKNRFIDLYNPCYFPVIGGCLVFDTKSFEKINGFPNNLVGWGGDDWALHKRMTKFNVEYHKLNGNVYETNSTHVRDQSSNSHNISLANADDYDTNGLNSCQYSIAGYGEFHDGHTIFHYLADI
jgi:hypothetical protein